MQVPRLLFQWPHCNGLSPSDQESDRVPSSTPASVSNISKRKIEPCPIKHLLCHPKPLQPHVTSPPPPGVWLWVPNQTCPEAAAGLGPDGWELGGSRLWRAPTGPPPSQGCFKLSHRSMAQPAPSPAPNHQCGFLASHCPSLIPAATIGPHVSPLAEHHGAGDRGSVPAHVMALASPLPKTDCQRKKSPSDHKKLLRKENEVIFQNTKSGFKTV